MALLGFEGFDNLSTSPQNDLVTMPFVANGVQTGEWQGYSSQFGTLSKVAGLLGGSGISQGTDGAVGGLTLFSNYATLICGFRFRCPTGSPISLTDIVRFVDGANVVAGSVQCGLSVNTVGKLIFWRGTNSTVLATGTTILVAGGWYMIDITVTIHNTTGAVQVNLGAASEITASGLNTRSTANNWTNGVQVAASGTTGAFDDLYCCDTTGSAPYNAPLGNIRVETLFVTANNSVAFTPLTGTNHGEVAETSLDGDTSYNSNTTTAIDTFTHGSLSSTPTTIFAVDVISAARKTDVKALSYRNKLISGATTTNGATNALATVYQYVRDNYLNDPNTGAPWAAAAVNATDIGYEKF